MVPLLTPAMVAFITAIIGQMRPGHIVSAVADPFVVPVSEITEMMVRICTSARERLVGHYQPFTDKFPDFGSNTKYTYRLLSFRDGLHIQPITDGKDEKFSYMVDITPDKQKVTRLRHTWAMNTAFELKHMVNVFDCSVWIEYINISFKKKIFVVGTILHGPEARPEAGSSREYAIEC